MCLVSVVLTGVVEFVYFKMPSTRSAKNKNLGDACADDVADLRSRMEQMTARFQQDMEVFKTQLVRAKDSENQDSSSVTEGDNNAAMDKLFNSFIEFQGLVNGELNGLKMQVDALNKSISQVKRMLDYNLQCSYRNRILMYGVPENNTETTTSMIDLVVDSVNKAAKDRGFKLQTVDVGDCYRYGRENSDRHRPILVEFVRPFIKGLVFANKSSFKGSDITIAEYLTKTRYAIYREAKKKFHRDSWTLNGNVYVKMNGEKKKINDISELS